MTTQFYGKIDPLPLSHFVTNPLTEITSQLSLYNPPSKRPVETSLTSAVGAVVAWWDRQTDGRKIMP